MRNEKLKNIDSIMTASDIVELLENKIEFSEKKLKTLVRSDGIAKRGNSMAVHSLSQGIGSANTVLHWLENKISR